MIVIHIFRCVCPKLYATFGNGRDALFDACDALLTETQARSFVELSLSPLFVRRWSRLYQAVQNAKIDREALRKAFACSAPAPTPDKRLVLGIDASSIARPQSPTARDRTYVHQSNLPQGSVPTAPGWQFSTLTALPDTPSSWTYILDHIRIQSQQTQGQAAAQQPTALVPQLASRPLLLGDGYYGGVTFLQQIADVPCDALLRLAKNRVLYRPAPPPTAGRGAPRKDGARFQPQDGAHREKMAPASHRRTGRTAKRWRPLSTAGRGAPRKDGARFQPQDGAHREKMAPASHRRTGRTAKRWRPPPTGGRGAPRKDGARLPPEDGASQEPPHATWSGTNRKGQPITVSVWRNLHFKDARSQQVNVYRVERPQAQDSKRDPRQSGFVFCGQTAPALSEVSDLYALRFSQEHGYRVDKQSLLWEAPRLRTPEQFQCGTDMVACVRNPLFLARSLDTVQRQPWEREARERTPPQVRRAMRGIIAQLGTPTRLPQLRGKSPGRRAGAIIKAAPRYKTIYKATGKIATVV